jgi:hypothetical protein
MRSLNSGNKSKFDSFEGKLETQKIIFRKLFLEKRINTHKKRKKIIINLFLESNTLEIYNFYKKYIQ